MRRVILLRHAKSSWDDPSLIDQDRPLARRGRKDAPRMGKFLRRAGLIPDAVLCSSARRARDTWSLVAEKLDQAPEPAIEEGLLMAAPRRLLARLRRLDDAFETVLMVGHNPGLEALAAGLAGSGKTGLLATLKTKFPTATVAVIDLPVDHWKDVAFGMGELVAFVRPGDLD